jgi:hypothetical protein
VLAARQHRQGQGAQAGADLDQGLARPRVDGADDVVDQRGVGQEVLAEALARVVTGAGTHSGGSRISMKAWLRSSSSQSL